MSYWCQLGQHVLCEKFNCICDCHRAEAASWADPLLTRERMHLRKVLARAALAPACPHRTVREMQELHLDVTERAAVPPDHPSRRRQD